MISAQLYPVHSRNYADTEEHYLAARAAVHSRLDTLDSKFTLSLSESAKKRGRWTQKGGLQCKTLVLALPPAAAFAAQCFQTSGLTVAGTLALNEDKTEKEASKKASLSTTLYLLGKDSILAVCTGRLIEARSHEWASELLSSKLSSEVVLVFDGIVGGIGAAAVSAAHEYSGEEGKVQIILTSAALRSESCRTAVEAFSLLVTPVMLQGPAAAVISFCQRRGKIAIGFIAVLGIAEGRTVARTLAGTLKALRLLAGDGFAISDVLPRKGEKTLEDEFIQRTENIYM